MAAGTHRQKKETKKNSYSSNNVKKIREQLLMSKAELARAAGLSVLTVDRVESGELCRMATKRKIIKALGFTIADKGKIFLK